MTEKVYLVENINNEKYLADESKNNKKSFGISKINNWQQVVVLIIIVGVVEVVSLIKTEIIIYNTIIIFALIGLAFFIVYRVTGFKTYKQSKAETRAIKLKGHIECLKTLNEYAQDRKKRTNELFDCKCFDKMIEELGSRINAFSKALK